MLTLIELEAELLVRESDRDRRITDDMAEADGVMFLCPKCFRENGGGKGTHSIICWFVGRVPDEETPKPGRWVPNGTSVGNLSFVGPSAASVALAGGCDAHFFVRNGAIEMC